ncbi:MAG: dTDP-glucose 4,6-dehydratase [Parvularculaceae bacterium]
MKLLVTGGAGFIGSAVVRRAVAQGHTVVNLDKLTYAANLQNVASVADHPNYAFIEADICDGEAVAEVFRVHQPDAVMNLAAETHVDRSIDGPAVFIETNILGAYRLLEESRRYYEGLPGTRAERFRFHQISTDEVYGSLGAEGLFREDTPYAPNSPYSASKASADMLARAWGRTFGLPVVVSNCSNNYGPYQFPEKLIPVVILAALENRPIPVYGAGENIRDWLYVEDHAEALLAIVERGRVGEIYNVGGRAERRNIDLIRDICAVMDSLAPDPDGAPHAARIEFVEDRPGHDLRYAIDCAKIENELGWRPSLSLGEGLELTARWYLDNPDWLAGLRARGFKAERLGLAKR